MKVLRVVFFQVIYALVFVVGTGSCSGSDNDNGGSCTPDCAGKKCGSDGCGGSCGQCVGDQPFCNNGACSGQCVSDDGCTEPGLTVCLDLTGHRTCEQVTTGCYQWAGTKTCENGSVCKNGGCVSSNSECGDSNPVVQGPLRNNVADMDFTGEEVSLQLFHKLDIDEWEDGCISKYVMDFSMMGLGCKFHLEMATSGAALIAVTSATLEADSFCPGWSDADEGEYLLKSSTLTLCSTVEVADYMTASACVPDVILGFGGALDLVRIGDGKILNVNLSDLTVHGDMTSLGDTELVCPEPCVGKKCGEDGCGGSCGVCRLDGICLDGECEYLTWDDPSSGLMWQNQSAGAKMVWTEAKQYCNGLDSAGYADWHLPTISDFRSLIRGCPTTETGGGCAVELGGCLASSCRNDSCDGCSLSEGPAGGCYWPEQLDGTCGWYWSATGMSANDVAAWYVDFNSGHVKASAVNNSIYVRCVR